MYYCVYDTFYTEKEDAITAAKALMNMDDVIDGLYNYIDYNTLAKWCLTQENFCNTFKNVIETVENEFIYNNVQEYEDNEIDRDTIIAFLKYWDSLSETQKENQWKAINHYCLKKK